MHRLIFAIAVLTALSLQGTVARATASCSGPVYSVGFNSDPLTFADDKAQAILLQPQVRVYEGKGWSNLTITRWNCVEDARAALSLRNAQESDGLPKYALFAAGNRVQTPKSDRVPESCAETVYVVGMYTVTDPAQYAEYSKALSASGLASSYGMTIPFGGNAPLAVSGGQWPENTTFNLTQWPCVEAMEAFLLGDEYRDHVFPLRDNAAVYNLTSFKPANAK